MTGSTSAKCCGVILTAQRSTASTKPNSPLLLPGWRIWLLLLVLAGHPATRAGADQPKDLSTLPAPAPGVVDYARDIQPLFASHCYKCHGPEKQKSDLRLDSRSAALQGGQRGPAIVAGRSADSPLIQYVAGLVEDMAMPPAKSGLPPLSPAEIGLLRAWIDQGAVWPPGADAKAPPRSKADYWVFQPATRPAVPCPGDPQWGRNGIDQFILARLEKEGLRPAPEADKSTLLRRVSYDLTGLPPTPGEAAQFLGDTRPDAYERLVERLLNSPRYGERWARHWLDTVHFGETHGYDKDKPRPNAWPYRDYVIRALNDDKPYARFVQEQLAGDILFPGDPDGIVALGFIAAGPWDFVGHVELPESKTDGLVARYNDRDDMVMTTMSTFQSLTVHCARCHDHKFDPISQEDYYSLQAVFAGVDRADRWFDSNPATFQQRKKLLAARQDLRRRQNGLHQRIHQTSPAVFQLIDQRRDELNKGLAALAKQKAEERLDAPQSAQAASGEPPQAALEKELERLNAERNHLLKQLVDPLTLQELAEVENRLSQVEAQLSALPPPQMVFAAANDFTGMGSFKPAGHPRVVHVLKRGEVKQPIHLAEPGALSCVPGLSSAFHLADPANEGDRRAALAEWITNPKNLLTRRSLVNRVWQYHFGRGLVETPNDFGHMGSAPSHPELLDWLAYWFQDHGESIKELHRLILTSATYRQSVAENPEFAKVDADNRYLWRMNRSRLDAESLHDSILFVSGQLDERMGGPSVQQFFFKDDHSPVYDYTRFDVDSPAARRRSVYRFIVRSVPDPFMETLDCPDASLLAARRSITVTALQALAQLNDPFVLHQCECFARRAQAEACDLSGQVRVVYQRALGRSPGPTELPRLLGYAQKHGLANLCRVVFNSSEFLFVD